MNWIKVGDRLPEENVKVLCFGEYAGGSPAMGGAYVFITHRFKKVQKHARKYFDENGFIATYVTHWMPLPEKPINK